MTPLRCCYHESLDQPFHPELARVRAHREHPPPAAAMLRAGVVPNPARWEKGSCDFLANRRGSDAPQPGEASSAAAGNATPVKNDQSNGARRQTRRLLLAIAQRKQCIPGNQIRISLQPPFVLIHPAAILLLPLGEGVD